jgi:hypothetical protein
MAWAFAGVPPAWRRGRAGSGCSTLQPEQAAGAMRSVLALRLASRPPWPPAPHEYLRQLSRLSRTRIVVCGFPLRPLRMES